MSDAGKVKVLAYPSVVAHACNSTTCWVQTDLEFEAIVGYRMRQTHKIYKTQTPNKTNKQTTELSTEFICCSMHNLKS